MTNRQKLLKDDPSIKYEFYSPSANRWFIYTIEGQKMSRSVYIYLKVHNLPNLPKGHVVHHINGDSADDRLENLLLVDRSRHGSFAKGKTKNRQPPVRRPLLTTKDIYKLIRRLGLEPPTWCEITPVGLRKLRQPTRDELMQTAELIAVLTGRGRAR
ncbi:MAG: HNH endonuclease [Deltaproteobacteria bacterium]|nr:HNH endonuclease [Deltaproteobacteria bacterium]